jgi:Domain of unknown function (DUF1877)
MGMRCAIKTVNPSAVKASLSQRTSSVHLEKAWHGLHYLLTGSASEGELPLAFLLQGGEEVGEDDGYGPPRLFSHDQVRELDSALAAISDDELWSRFDPQEMSAEGVYPDIWDEEEEELREEYLTYFHEIKNIVTNANAGKQALVVMLT